MHSELPSALASLGTRRTLLFGGKGGVGKTTIAIAAALHFSASRPAILFTTDPASSLDDLFRDGTPPPLQLTIEALDAEGLWKRFLDEHLGTFLEIGDRGTYLDREELRRLFALALPGVDELMAWMRIGELSEQHPEAMLIVDTAPTGHTLRMLRASGHFAQLAAAFDAMQEKHRALVFQFTRRDVRDAIDEFIDAFETRAKERLARLQDPALSAFVPVTLAEPLVIEQTVRLIDEVGMDVPFVILNRATQSSDALRGVFSPRPVIHASRACVPLDSPSRISEWMQDGLPPAPVPATEARPPALPPLSVPRLTFLAGKGGVGKTTCSASIALQLAVREPEGTFVVISVDPAHSLPELFAHVKAPSNLRVETIDTRAKWLRFRESLGNEIVDAFDSLAPRGMSIAHDAEAMRRLIEIAPPGADELFAITRLADLLRDPQVAGIVVDTAPTGHFLRLLELPRVAGEWVREFMRLLLRYKDLIPAGSLGEELVNASRALKELDAALHADGAAVVVVTRPERIVVAETVRLLHELQSRQIRVAGILANAMSVAGGDACEESLRSYELAALAALPPAHLLNRREQPLQTLDALLTLVPLA
jgi:arsenite/tail-anchored protein-transporting ATPase